MSWHFLPELAAEYLADICLDGDASAQSSTISTQEACCSQDSETGTCQCFQSGTTCEPSTDDRGMEWLTLYQAAFRAKTLVPQEKEQASKGRVLDSGKKWLELSMKYDRNAHSWRTHRCLFDEDLPQSLVTLPKWGMMRSGVLFRLRTAEHPTKENASGFWPTPRASDHKGAVSPFAAQKARERIGGCNLPEAIMESEYFRMFATPTARDWKDNGKSPAELARNSETLASQAGGKLNPNWVEWLMGWPIGWTDLDALGMDKFQSWQQQHGVS